MRGRRPKSDNVVPLTTSGGGANLDERARQRAAEALPSWLSKEARAVWRAEAHRVAHATVDRLKPHFVTAFGEYCEALARLRRLRKEIGEIGEIYESETRNGLQMKSRPEVAQLNEAFRQYLTLARDFGLTPSAERGLKAAGQGDLFDPADAYFDH